MNETVVSSGSEAWSRYYEGAIIFTETKNDFKFMALISQLRCVKQRRL